MVNPSRVGLLAFAAGRRPSQPHTLAQSHPPAHRSLVPIRTHPLPTLRLTRAYACVCHVAVLLEDLLRHVRGVHVPAGQVLAPRRQQRHHMGQGPLQAAVRHGQEGTCTVVSRGRLWWSHAMPVRHVAIWHSLAWGSRTARCCLVESFGRRLMMN